MSELPAEAAIRFLIDTYDVDEAQARLMVAIERGEISGDTFEVADADEARTA